MILILDEPTNFLDENHIEWLTTFLKNYENSFILVSHDIPFLDRVVNVIYHVEDAKLTRYTGSYEQFRQMYELKKLQNQQAYEKQQKEIDKLEDFIARNKARAATANLAKSRQKKLDGLDIIELSREKAKPSFKFREARTPGKLIFTAKDLVIGYTEPLTRPLDIQLERGQKVAVKGVNGLGKSTLLKTLMGLIPPVSGTVTHDHFLIPGYFEQESANGNTLTAMEEIWKEYPGLSNGEVRAALARCTYDRAHSESDDGIEWRGKFKGSPLQAHVEGCELSGAG
jgi:ATPase subunit of ABC transporter with duplicated ATPase domains